MQTLYRRMGRQSAAVNGEPGGPALKEVGNWFSPDMDVLTPNAGLGGVKEIITLQFASNGKETVLLNKETSNFIEPNTEIDKIFNQSGIIMDNYGTKINYKSIPGALAQATSRMHVGDVSQISKAQQIKATGLLREAKESKQDKNSAAATKKALNEAAAATNGGGKRRSGTERFKRNRARKSIKKH